MTRTSIFIACALGLAFLPVTAQAGKADFRLDTTAPAPKSLTVDVSWLDVNVKAITGDKVTVKAEVKVEVTGGDEKAQKCLDANKVMLETDGDRLIIRQGKKGESRSCSFFGSSNMSGHLDVGVPAGIPFGVHVASGDIRIEGDFGPVDLSSHAASGNLTFAGQARSLEVDSASGDVRIEALQPFKRVKVDTASGGTILQGGAEDADISAASGDIVLSGLVGGAKLEAASGDITAAWTKAPAGSRIEVEAASGDVSLTFPAGTSIGGRLETSSGALKSDVLGKPSDERGTFNLGGKDVMLEVETASGDISVIQK